MKGGMKSLEAKVLGLELGRTAMGDRQWANGKWQMASGKWQVANGKSLMGTQRMEGMEIGALSAAGGCDGSAGASPHLEAVGIMAGRGGAAYQAIGKGRLKMGPRVLQVLEV
jgi:hypothetical protein